MAKTAEQMKREQAAAMEIWAAKHGELAKKVLKKKTKQSGKKAIKSVVDEKRITGGQDISTLKSKPSPTRAVRSTSTSKNSSATPKPKPTAKAKAKPTAKAKAKPELRSDGLRNLVGKGDKTKSPRDKMPYAGKFPGEPDKKETKTRKKPRYNSRGRRIGTTTVKTSTKKPSGPKKGDTKTATIQGVKYIMTWNGSRWTSKKAGGKG